MAPAPWTPAEVSEMPYDDFEVADRKARRAKGQPHTLTEVHAPRSDVPTHRAAPHRPVPVRWLAVVAAVVAAALAAYKATR